MAHEGTITAAVRRVRRREVVFGLVGPVLPAGPERWTRGAPVLLYHRIAPAGRRSADPFTVAADAFDRQMTWLTERFTVVTVGELVRRLAAGEGPGLAAVSFDDGYDCTVAQALPVLRAQGVPATVFVDTGRLNGPPPALHDEDLLALANAGAEIGSHSITHPDLTQLEGTDLDAELTGSRERLRAITGEPIAGFAMPFGRTDARVSRAVAATGYAYACTGRQDRTNLPGDDPYQLTRIEINATDTSRRFEAKLRGRYAPLYSAWYRLSPALRRRLEQA